MRENNRIYIAIVLAAVIGMIATGCSMQKNTAMNRFRNAFTAKYNTYYNGSLAFIDGSQEKEKGNKDNFTEIIPLYTVGNKASRDIGKGNFGRAIEKSEKAIKLHSMKQRPAWTKKRRKTAEDIEWLSRREYNPFIWRAWLLMGKSQFQMGNFDEAAATFSYMSRLYATQPAINGIARAWQAKSYIELGWLYDAEDVIVKMRRDSMHYKARADWDYTMADFHIHKGEYKEAVPYLRKVIKHEKRRKQKAREWFLMGQLQTTLGNNQEAYKAYQKVIRLNPPYELEFNARVAQTEVMAAGQSKKMIRKLKRMARSDNNAQYLDQVYYAIGNIYLAEKDTANAIAAYETGNEKATRSGVEKGVLLLKLGNLYWEKERYSDAKRCYGEAIGMLDKERDDYDELAKRSQILDELVPHTDAIHLQDSLQTLASMPEDKRNEAIDRVIEELIKKEKEEKRKAEELEAEKQQQRQGAQGNRQRRPQTTGAQANQSGVWYFYNPQAVNQGKQAFQREWGKRDNVDDWQRNNRTVVNLAAGEENPEDSPAADSLAADSTLIGDEATAEAETKKEKGDDDELDPAEDPHKREYYLAQIPFTEEQKAESDNILKDALFNSGVIFKDKLDNLKLSKKALERLTTQYADYEKNDETWYHLWLLYSRLGLHDKAETCLDKLKTIYPESQWTILLSDPNFAENAQFGVQIEDSLYAATYDAFRDNKHQEIKTNAKISRERFPLGLNRPKFIFIEALSMLHDNDTKGCVKSLTEIIEKHPQSEISPMAGMILKGVQAGRTLEGGAFDINGIWERRSIELTADSASIKDTLTIKRDVPHTFLLAFVRDSVNENQLLYEMARYNFSNFMVRNFDMSIDDDNGIRRMLFTGFANYDEALQYARQLAGDATMTRKLQGCRRIIISNDNLKLLGVKYSYSDYETFFQNQIAPLPVSDEDLLEIPETIVSDEMPETPNAEEAEGERATEIEGEAETDNSGLDGIVPIDQPATPTEEPTTPTEEPSDFFDQPTMPTEEPTTPTEEPTDFFDQPTTPTEEPTTPTEEPTDFFDQPTTPTEEPTTPTEEPAEIDEEESAIPVAEPETDEEEEPIDVLDDILGTPPTDNNQEQIIDSYDFDEDFYR